MPGESVEDRLRQQIVRAVDRHDWVAVDSSLQVLASRVDKQVDDVHDHGPVGEALSPDDQVAPDAQLLEDCEKLGADARDWHMQWQDAGNGVVKKVALMKQGVGFLSRARELNTRVQELSEEGGGSDGELGMASQALQQALDTKDPAAISANMERLVARLRERAAAGPDDSLPSHDDDSVDGVLGLSGKEKHPNSHLLHRDRWEGDAAQAETDIFDLVLAKAQDDYTRSLLHEASREPLNIKLEISVLASIKVGWLRFKLWFHRLFGYNESYYRNRAQSGYRLARELADVADGQQKKAGLSQVQRDLLVDEVGSGEGAEVEEREIPSRSLLSELRVDARLADTMRVRREHVLPFALYEHAGVYAQLDLRKNTALIRDNPWLRASLIRQRADVYVGAEEDRAGHGSAPEDSRSRVREGQERGAERSGGELEWEISQVAGRTVSATDLYLEGSDRSEKRSGKKIAPGSPAEDAGRLFSPADPEPKAPSFMREPYPVAADQNRQGGVDPTAGDDALGLEMVVEVEEVTQLEQAQALTQAQEVELCSDVERALVDESECHSLEQAEEALVWSMARNPGDYLGNDSEFRGDTLEYKECAAHFWLCKLFREIDVQLAEEGRDPQSFQKAVSENVINLLINLNEHFDGYRGSLLARLPLGFFVERDVETGVVSLKFSEKHRVSQLEMDSYGLKQDPFGKLLQLDSPVTMQQEDARYRGMLAEYESTSGKQVTGTKASVWSRREDKLWHGVEYGDSWFKNACDGVKEQEGWDPTEMRSALARYRRADERSSVGSAHNFRSVQAWLSQIIPDAERTRAEREQTVRCFLACFSELVGQRDIYRLQRGEEGYQDGFEERNRSSRLDTILQCVMPGMQKEEFFDPEVQRYFKELPAMSDAEFNFCQRTLLRAGKAMSWTDWYGADGEHLLKEASGVTAKVSIKEIFRSFWFFRRYLDSHGLTFEQFLELDLKYLDGANDLGTLMMVADCLLRASDQTQLDHIAVIPRNYTIAKQALTMGYRFVHRDMCFGGFVTMNSRHRQGSYWADDKDSSLLNQELRTHDRLLELGFSALAPIGGEQLQAFDRSTSLANLSGARSTYGGLVPGPAYPHEAYRICRAIYLRYASVSTDLTLTEALEEWQACVPEEGRISPDQWCRVKSLLSERTTELAGQAATEDETRFVGAGAMHQDRLMAMQYANKDIKACLAKMSLPSDKRDRLRGDLRQLSNLTATYQNLGHDELKELARRLGAGVEGHGESDAVTQLGTVERLAVLRELYKRATGKWLRLEQAAAVLLAYENNAVLEQDTGEGKTVTIQLTAVLHALEGRKVDVLTHNAKLAENAALDMLKLASLLGLSVAHRGDGVGHPDTDIFYTDIPRAVIDELVQAYAGDGREGRRADVGLFDEVDNEFVDMASQTTMRLAKSRRDNENGDDLYRFLCVMNQIAGEEELLSIEDLRVRLAGDAYFEQSEMPDDRLQRWYGAARKAVTLRKGVQYVLVSEMGEDDKPCSRVRIVHKDTTGRVDDHSQWSDGVHQLVAAREMQEQRAGRLQSGDALPPVEMPVMSEVILEGDIPSFAARYDRRSGFTGTTGDQPCQDALRGLLHAELMVALPRAKRVIDPSQTEPLSDTGPGSADQSEPMDVDAKSVDQSDTATVMSMSDTSSEFGEGSEEAASASGAEEVWPQRSLLSEEQKWLDPPVSTPWYACAAGPGSKTTTCRKVMAQTQYNRRYDMAPVVHVGQEAYFRDLLEAIRGAQSNNYSTLLFLNTIEECDQFYGWLVDNGIDPSLMRILDDTGNDSSGQTIDTVRPPEDLVVNQAGLPHRVTLTTAAGGRGTDFKDIDVAILAKPGLKRIKDQMVGRVGRNGQLATTHEIYWAEDFGGRLEVGLGVDLPPADDPYVQLAEGEKGQSLPEQLVAWQERREAKTLERLDQRVAVHGIRSAIQTSYLEARQVVSGRQQEELDAHWKAFMSQVELIPRATEGNLPQYAGEVSRLLEACVPESASWEKAASAGAGDESGKPPPEFEQESPEGMEGHGLFTVTQ